MALKTKNYNVPNGSWEQSRDRVRQLFQQISTLDIPAMETSAGGVLDKDEDPTSDTFGQIILVYDTDQFDESPAGTFHLQHFDMSGATTVLDEPLEILSTSTPQLKLSYDDSNDATFSVSSGGDLTINASGGDISFGNENLVTTGTFGAGVATLATGSTIGNLTLANGSITDSGGSISFGDENISTTGQATLTDLSVPGTFIPRSTHLSWDSLIGYWPGNGTGHDYGPSGRQGTWTGNEAYTTGRFGQCMDFDAVSYVTTINSTNVTTAVTVAGWVNLDSSHSDILAVAIAKNYHLTNNPVDCWMLYQDELGGANDTKWVFSIGWGLGAADFSTVASTAAAVKDTWVFLTGTYDGSNLRLYINGVLDNTTAKSGSIVTSARPHYIGMRLTGATYSEWKGQLDELMVFNRVLSADEIKSLYERRESFETFGFPTGLIIGDDSSVQGDLGVSGDLNVITDLDVVGVTTLNDDTIFLGSGSGLVYGEISAYDAGSTVTISGIGIANKRQITAFNANGLSNFLSPDHTNDHITIDIAGVYLCTVSISAESAAAGGADEFGFAVYKNNGATLYQNLHSHREVGGGGGDTGSISLSGIIDLAVNDTIEVWCWNEDSTDNLVIDDITLSLVQIGGT